MNSTPSFPAIFANAERLIIDLRGNPGGGIGGLTLMSYLTPGRIPIGYSWNRKMAQDRRAPNSLQIPRSKLAIPGLAIKVSNISGIGMESILLAMMR